MVIIGLLVGISHNSWADNDKKLFSKKDLDLLSIYKSNDYIIKQQKEALGKNSKFFFNELMKYESRLSLDDLKKEQGIDIWALRDKADYDILFFELLARYQRESYE